MEYMVNDELLRETGCLFKGKVNDVMTAGRVWSEDEQENKYVILKVKDAETSKKLAGILSKFNRRDFKPFSVGDSYCIRAPYVKRRGIVDYVFTVAEGFDQIVDVCREMVRRCILTELPDAIKYLMVKERKLNVQEDGGVYFTYDLDLTDLDENVTEKECARECGYLIEELVGDEKYAEFISVKLLREKNSRGGYESYRDIILDVNNMKYLGRVPKRFDGLREFINKYLYVILKGAAIIGVIALCVAVIIYLFNTFDIGSSFDIIGTENLAKP